MRSFTLVRGAPRRNGARDVKVLASLAGLGIAAFCLTGAAEAQPIRIVAFGDSLTAGYQLPDADGFVPRLQAALRKQGHDVTVVNAGVSGDTTTDGLARMDWTLADGADAVILELGANDMLRGIDWRIAEANLSKMLAGLKTRHIKVLLVGMHALKSMGAAYDKDFEAIYPDLARDHNVPLYPFFAEGMMGDRSQHLPDQIHPNAKGVDTIVARILPSVDALLKEVDPKS